jgi:hypothetical protein
MSEQPTQEQIDQWHRWFGIQCNNGTWDLIDKTGRTPLEDSEMLAMAYTSVYHWSKVGKPVHIARGEINLAHVHALLGHGDLALEYATRCLEFFESNECEDWDLAFAHAEMAHAAAVVGDAALHKQHHDEARRRGESIHETEDREVFLAQFASIPDHVRAK